MFTKEYVREVLNQMCAPYMAIPLSDEYVQKIYDDFVKIRNDEAVEHAGAGDVLRCGHSAGIEFGESSWVCVVCRQPARP